MWLPTWVLPFTKCRNFPAGVAGLPARGLAMLDSDQLKLVVEVYQERFGEIKKEYQDLKAYLVFCMPPGQVELDATTRQILQQFPEMVVDGPAKKDALKIVSEIRKAEKQDKSAEADRLTKQLGDLVPRIRYDDNVRVEIRFKDLRFKLVWALQADELVNRDLTPQTKASIRIVLGTLSAFNDTKI
jgi:hypothetical protein